LGVFTVEKIKVPIFGQQTARKLQALSGNARTDSELKVLDQPDASAEQIGQVQKGASLAVQGEFKDFYKIGLGEGRFAFAKKSDLELGQKGAPLVFAPTISRAAPRLLVEAKTLATRDDSVSIDVISTDTTGGVQDAFIFVGSDKVFYTPNPTPNGQEMKFTFNVPLKAGVNVITVVAREDEDIATRHRIVVRKDGPNGEILPTPKNDLFGEDWEFGAP
jgi:carboxyl-terminal processing protease